MSFNFIPPSRSGTVQEANVYQKVPAYANACFRNAKRCYNDIDNENENDIDNVIVIVNEYDNDNVNEYVNDDVNENELMFAMWKTQRQNNFRLC